MARIRSEPETTTTFNEADADALVWSASPRVHRRMEKRGSAPYKIEKGSPGAEESEQSRWYRIPKEWLPIRPPRKVSEAERARLTKQGFHGPRDREGQPQHIPRAKIVRPVSTRSSLSCDE